MLRTLCRKILFDALGWRTEVTAPHRDKCIICVAPHTSNLDFFVAELYYLSIGRRAGFLMKREWFFWPLGPLLRRIGGVPVVRDKASSLTDRLAEKARAATHFELAVTPEGTRSRNSDWRRGFYFIALKAGLPIQLYAIDYPRRLIHCTRELTPSGDVERDMATIKQYYRGFTGRHPERFTTGDASS